MKVVTIHIRQINKIVLILGAIILFFSCDPNQVYEKNVELTDLKWHKDSVIIFKVDVQDTLSAHNVYINIRNTSQYQMQNLFLFIKATSPNGTVLRDTFECYLADERGKWTGSGWGDIYDNQFIYKRNVRFPLSGTYTFEYVQAMRTEELKYISDLGLRVEKVKLR